MRLYGHLPDHDTILIWILSIEGDVCQASQNGSGTYDIESPQADK